ncbi:MAG: GNAT family acetyltransferase [Acidimicrobiia bacterium]
MDIRCAEASDCDDAASLWERCGLTRPWNDARQDFHRALNGLASTVLLGVMEQQVVAAAMVGYDGHRGWIYYLAVDPAHRRRRLGERMVTAAEDWLRANGCVKSQLLVRPSNSEALGFYERLGYERSDVHVFARWLSTGEASGTARGGGA